jgi:hypothetical protein
MANDALAIVQNSSLTEDEPVTHSAHSLIDIRPNPTGVYQALRTA